MRELPRDLVTILRTEARNQRTPPIDYVVAEDGGRMVHRPEPNIAMAELLEEAADALEAARAARTDGVKVKPLDEHDYEKIISAAAINMRKAAGIRGQMITVQDGLDWWVMKETEHRILSALEAQIAERVRVKPLVWRGTEGVWAKADALFGATYRITDYAGMAKPFKLETVGFVGPNGHYGTLDDAKAAAQADFERRILSALEPAASGVRGVGWTPITEKNGVMTCSLPADETVVEVMLKDGTVCRAWYSCNLMEAGDWDFVPVAANGEPDDDADSIASDVVAWRPALKAAMEAGHADR